MPFTEEELAAMAAADAEIEAEFDGPTWAEIKTAEDIDRAAKNRKPVSDDVKCARREYYLKNKARINARSRAWYAANKKRVNEKRRQRYQENREQELARNREYYRANREKRIATSEQYRARQGPEYAEKCRAYAREYYRKRVAAMTPEERAEFNAKRAERMREYRKTVERYEKGVESD